MSDDFWIRLSIAAMVPVTAVITWFLNRSHEDKDSTILAITAVADASHTVVDLMADIINPLKEQLESHTIKIREQEKGLKELNGHFQLLVAYTESLREQVIDLGHEPVPFPEELKHLK